MKRFDSERGAQLIEFALVLPILLLIVAAIAEFGLLLRSAEITVNAAREGARLAVLPGNEQNDYATVRARVDSYLASSYLSGTATTAVAEESIPVAAGVTAGGVRVTVTYTYDCLFLGPIAGLVNGTFAGTISYQSSALMRKHLAAVGL